MRKPRYFAGIRNKNSFKAMISSVVKFETFVFLGIWSFAVVLEAAPQFPSTERCEFDQCNRCDCYFPQENRRFSRQSELLHGYEDDDQRPSGFFAIDDPDQVNEEDSYDFKRLPRSGETSTSNFLSFNGRMNKAVADETIYAKPRSARYPQGKNMLYVVRPADYIDEKNNKDDEIDDDPFLSAKLNVFPISTMKQESYKFNPGLSLSDEKLGRIIRKAITDAKYENFEGFKTRSASQTSLKNPLTISNNQAAIPKNYHRKMNPKNLGERVFGFAKDLPADKTFELMDSEASMIADMKNVEVQPAIAQDISLSETEPEVYKFVDDLITNEEGSDERLEDKRIDDVIEGDMVLTEIENHDEKEDEESTKKLEDKRTDGDGLVTQIRKDYEKKLEKAEEHKLKNLHDAQIQIIDATTETPASATEDDKISRGIDGNLNFSDGDDERPSSTTDFPFTGEIINDRSTTTEALS